MNPHVTAWRRQRRNRRRTDGLALGLGRLVLVLVGTALLVAMLRPVLLGFLGGPRDHWGAGVGGVVFRMGLIVVGVLALDLYTALIRGRDREVLALLPVDPAAVASAATLRTAASRFWLLVGCGLVLGPVAWMGACGLWALAVLGLVGLAAVGLTSAALVHLLAVDAAESPTLAPLLDLVRGQNPREQAAFIYAPGVILAGVGGLVLGVSSGVESVWLGDAWGWLWLVLPFPVAVVAWLPVPRMARRSWFRASGVLADIDARYGSLVEQGEANRVYLEGLVRFLPARVALYALKDLRHGWRARRTWITGAWLLGVAAGLAGWTADPTGPLRAAVVAVASVALCATVGVLLERDEPPFLRRWLPAGGAPRWVARALVLVGWLQACLPLAAVAVAIRRSLPEAGAVLLISEIAVIGLVGLALATSLLRERALWVYAPAAAVGAAGLLAVGIGGVL